MKRLSTAVLALTALILAPLAIALSNSKEPAQMVFQVATSLACAEKQMQCRVLSVSREELGHDLVYYRALIKVDSGDYDVIALNHVVRERRHGFQAHTAGSLFFIHGSSGNFRMILIAPHGGNGLGIFLGKQNIDVWGIDLRNVQIPADALQPPNAHDWGFDQQVKDVRLATRIARWTRALTGQGADRIILSGHSAGAALGYAVVNAEAAASRAQRDVGGIIPIEMVYKLPPSAANQIQLSCNVASFYKSVSDAGTYFFNNLKTIAMGKLAQTDPNGVSTNSPLLTNQQYLLESASGLSFRPTYPFHGFAVVRNASGVASQGRYTWTADIAANYANSAPYPISNAMIADMFSPSCPTIDTPHDDNLAEVKIPVFYIGAAGGFGAFGEYTLNLLGSSDVTKLMIQLGPDEDAANDFGHMEAFTGTNVEQLVWEPMRKWIVDHQTH